MMESLIDSLMDEDGNREVGADASDDEDNAILLQEDLQNDSSDSRRHYLILGNNSSTIPTTILVFCNYISNLALNYH